MSGTRAQMDPEHEKPELSAEEKEAIRRAKPFGGRDMSHLKIKDFLAAPDAMAHAHGHAAPEAYREPHRSHESYRDSGDPLAGVLHDRGAPLPIERNPQTLAEHALALADRPTHYTAGLRATLCEVYHASKQTTNSVLVTCPECLKLMRRTGR
jgi:hypothetical protein